MTIIDPATLVRDLEFYSKQFVNPPQIYISEEGSIHLDDVIIIELNIGKLPITRPAIVPTTRKVMHHRIMIKGPDGIVIEDTHVGIAEKAIKYWTHHKYWKLVNERL